MYTGQRMFMMYNLQEQILMTIYIVEIVTDTVMVGCQVVCLPKSNADILTKGLPTTLWMSNF